MKYVKPEVRVLASSMDAIQSSMNKGYFTPVEDFGQRLHATSSAYEADE
ncbi:MAG TPA: hypothetical protein VN946_19435 [Terriglobales bacterium]|jgi:hypothetical protein|nr:hypothetical protein [Terriglobales bacterium]